MGYWQKRYEELEQSRHDLSLKSIGQVRRTFQDAQRQISDKILLWYVRLAENNEVSLAEARKMLTQAELKEFKWTVDEYIKYGEKNGITGELKKELENASARYHISRYGSLMVQLRAEAEKCYQAYHTIVSDHLGKIYEDSFYKSIFELGKEVSVGKSVERLNPDLIEKVIHKPWASDGKDFSDRIWQDKAKLVNSLEKNINRVCILGESPDKAIASVEKDLQTSRNNASRLIMTETAYFGNLAEKDSFDRLGIKEYEIVATLDSRTSEICQDMDGKHFPISEFKVGISAPPFHPNCRSCTCPYFDDEFEKGGERAARDEDGEVYYIPQNMTYKEWKKSFVDGEDKSNLKTVNTDDNAVAAYTASRKEYDLQVQRLAELEKETDNALNAYMDAMDTPQEAEVEAVFNNKFDETESLKQIVKDLKAALSGKEARAVRQIEKQLANLTGIPIKKVEMTGLQFDTAEMIYNSYDIVLKKFPELKGQLASFKFVGTKGDAYAGCRMISGEIKAYGKFSDYDRLAKSYANDVAIGFHPVGTDHNSIIVHELGHALDGYMTKKGMLGAKFSMYGTERSASDVAKGMTLKFLGFDKQEISLELKSQGLNYHQRRDILEQREKKFIAEYVSEYALENEKEFFAECFAEYMMSDNPREAAKIFGEIIETALGR